MKRAQAAMEFLMTYGWAILIVIVAISAMAYFGVLSSDNLKPFVCRLPPGLTCTDHSYANGKFSFYLVNNLGKSIVLEKIVANGCDTNRPYAYLNNNQGVPIILNCVDFQGDLTLSYSAPNLGLSFTEIGKGSGSGGSFTPPSNPSTSELYCTNANNNGLCDLLNLYTDISDYKQNCCSEWKLCCG